MNEVLYTLCRHCVGIMDGWIPYPSTVIAKSLNMPVGKVRYQLKKLKTQGLVVNDSYGGQTEDGEVFCINGFTVTEKAEKTEEYIKAYNEERELCKRTLDIDIGEMKK